MQDSYTILRVIAGSWGLVFMFTAFLVVIYTAFRPGSRKVHRDIANIPFRHDDKPAAGPVEVEQ